MQRTKWTERIFNFDVPDGWLFNILERLRGTAARMKEMTDGLSNDALVYQPNGRWSIKEHIGHLADLEEIHDGRLDDFIQRKEMLRPADMSNAKTVAANHNEKPVTDLIAAFITKRNNYIARLEELDDETLQFKSMHPRLKVLARPVDMAYFTAEHDDHHLATIREILNDTSLPNNSSTLGIP